MKQQFYYLFFCLCIATIPNSMAQQLVLGPYLQDGEPNSMVVMWETSLATPSKVHYGLTPELGSEATGGSSTGFLFSRVHRVKLAGLQPSTIYYYSVNGGNKYSDTVMFKTPPLLETEERFGMIAFSDMQKDQGQPNKFKEIVEEGVLPFSDELEGATLPDKLAFVLVPGDLVDLGILYPSWKDEFFEPAKPLFEMVPVYPVLGNHEANTAFFFNYFDLPKNGTTGFMEHWWYKDYSNTRIIGLESNVEWITGNNGIQKQLDWLQEVLDEACAMENIDFVFAQLHHPYHSELWPDGNSDFTGDVIELLENFTTSCGKPSIHFYGHTHGYSRGQSQDHKHLMVNVASAGGNLDRWGEYANQTDYPEHSVSEDKYGFVYLEVEGGDDPKFSLKRVSRGAPGAIEDNIVSDSLVVYKNNNGPTVPVGLYPFNETVSPECLRLDATAFSTSSPNALHGASQWQIFSNCADLSSPVLDIWQQYENRYFDVDLQAGHDLTTQDVSSGLLPFSDYCWRVRYRDQNLRWSDWSEPLPFSTGRAINLLTNNGAENGTDSWTAVSGAIESLAAGECDGNAPYMGSRYFAVGAACQSNAYGEAHQIVDVSSYSEQVDSGVQTIWFGGHLSDYNGTDKPEFRLSFLDESSSMISQTQKFGGKHSSWISYDQQAILPIGTRSVQFEISGTRGLLGVANDSYFDELYLVIDSLAGSIDTTICSGESVDILGTVLSEPGTYYLEDPTADECLNRYRVTLGVLDTFYTSLEESICPGDSFEVAGHVYADPGSYSTTTSAANGCDSTILLHLSLLGSDDPLCSVPTGIEEILKFGTAIYPNPFNSEAVLQLPLVPPTPMQMKIYNDAGELVKIILSIQSETTVIHRDELANGVYQFTLQSNDVIYYKGNFIIGH